MFSVILCLGATHDLRFVVGAIVVCLIGAFSTVIMLVRAHECAPKHAGHWIAAAACTGGTSIWATHFIAMLAYDGGYPLSYDGPITALSVLVSIAMSWAAFAASFRSSNPLGVAGAGGLFGMGIAAMHFTGMLAITTQGHLTYAPGPVTAALAACLFFGSLALLVVRFLVGRLRVLLGSFLVAGTVCALHFASMSGVTLTPDPLLASQSSFQIDPAALAAIVAAVSSAIVLIGGAAAVMDRHLTDVRGLADAAMEGLLIVQQGKIVEVNQSFMRLFGGPAQGLQGTALSDILSHRVSDSSDPNSVGVFGQLIKADGSRTEVEVLSRGLEYRGRQCQALAIRDLSERRKSERMIDHLARHDSLTGLVNRREFDIRMAQLMLNRAQGPRELAVLCLDLDNFKAVNDGRGHAAGDAVLRAVADVLKGAAGAKDFVARLGGDEFAVVQVGQPQPAAAEKLSQELMTRISELKNSDAQLVSVGTSIGVAIARQPEISAEILHGHADAALYEAKKAGRGAIRFFDSALETRLKLKLESEAELVEALFRREFVLDYQPFTSASKGTILGYRASIYWKHPIRGMLSASSFLPTAKECGLLNSIVSWMFKSAAMEAATWPADLKLAVPLSDFHLSSPGCYEEISRIVRRAGLDPRRLDLVIPEAALTGGDAGSSSILQRFEALGVGIIVTDLLSDQSAMATLYRFGLDRVTVDAASLARFEDRYSPHVHRAAVDFLRATGFRTIITDVRSKELHPTPATSEGTRIDLPGPHSMQRKKETQPLAAGAPSNTPRVRRQVFN